MDPISFAIVIAAAVSSSFVKDVVNGVYEKIKDRLKDDVVRDYVTVVGPNGTKIVVDPTKPVTEDQLRTITAGSKEAK